MRARPLDVRMFGMQAVSVQIDSHTQHYPLRLTGGHMLSFKAPTETNMFITLMSDSMDNYNLIHAAIGKELVGLGDGKICDYCNTYWPSGNYICWNCGGELGTYPFIKPVATGGVMTSLNVEVPVAGLVSVNLEVSGILELPGGFLEGLMAKFVPCATGVMTRYYLCEWCGHAVESGKACYGCGGPRTPLRELVDMDHECSWCGSNTINGIICETCGTRVQERTIGEVI